MISPVIRMCPEVDKYFHIIELPLPNEVELFALQSELGKQTDIQTDANAARAAMGLTEFEAETAYALSLIRKGRFSTSVISEAKSQMIRKSGLMEFWSPADINDVGGLGNLKAFIQNRSKAFLPENSKLPHPGTHKNYRRCCRGIKRQGRQPHYQSGSCYNSLPAQKGYRH